MSAYPGTRVPQPYHHSARREKPWVSDDGWYLFIPCRETDWIVGQIWVHGAEERPYLRYWSGHVFSLLFNFTSKSPIQVQIQNCVFSLLLKPIGCCVCYHAVTTCFHAIRCCCVPPSGWNRLIFSQHTVSERTDTRSRFCFFFFWLHRCQSRATTPGIQYRVQLWKQLATIPELSHRQRGIRSQSSGFIIA